VRGRVSDDGWCGRARRAWRGRDAVGRPRRARQAIRPGRFVRRHSPGPRRAYPRAGNARRGHRFWQWSAAARGCPSGRFASHAHRPEVRAL